MGLVRGLRSGNSVCVQSEGGSPYGGEIMGLLRRIVIFLLIILFFSIPDFPLELIRAYNELKILAILKLSLGFLALYLFHLEITERF